MTQSLSKILSVFTLIRTITTLIKNYQDFMIVFILQPQFIATLLNQSICTWRQLQVN